MNKNDKFTIVNGTIDLVVSGYGNNRGNMELANLDNKEVEQMILEKNTKRDDVRLIISLLGTIRDLKNANKNKRWVSRKGRFKCKIKV